MCHFFLSIYFLEKLTFYQYIQVTKYRYDEIKLKFYNFALCEKQLSRRSCILT